MSGADGGQRGAEAEPWREGVRALAGLAWASHLVEQRDLYRMVQERPHLYVSRVDPAVVEAFVAGFGLARSLAGAPLSSGEPPQELFVDWLALRRGRAGGAVADLLGADGEAGCELLWSEIARYAALTVEVVEVAEVVRCALPRAPSRLRAVALSDGTAWLCALPGDKVLRPVRPSLATVRQFAELAYGVGEQDWRADGR